eukprot:SAG31_NODE_7574_length_1650_cov_1.629916_1_plen_87_part_00
MHAFANCGSLVDVHPAKQGDRSLDRLVNQLGAAVGFGLCTGSSLGRLELNLCHVLTKKSSYTHPYSGSFLSGGPLSLQFHFAPTFI